MLIRAGLLILVLLAAASDARADVRLPTIFSDHMVLQREAPIPVWGWGDPGERVTVKLAGQARKTTVGENGRWRIEFGARKAGGPHSLVVRGANKLTVRDVLIGEVWLCSGQSNMAWTVAQSRDAKEEIAAARDPKIRHILIPRKTAGTPQDDVTASWQVCSPETVGGFTAAGYFMARELRRELRVSIGLVHSSWGGTRIEPWTPLAGLAGNPALADIARQAEAAVGQKPSNAHQPVVLYNGMIHALVGFSMRGAIWYQGESNRYDGALYAEKMKALIGSWRSIWGIGEFPFYYVQIAPFQYGKDSPHTLPVFWEAQAAVLDVVPNTGMVVTNDIATPNNIHPPNKQDVGKRLALLALHRTYGKEVADSGPTFRAMVVEGASLRVSFDHAKGGLRSRDKLPLTNFEIAGASTGFVPAEVKIDGDTVVLTAKQVAEPVAMRFAWHKLAEPNLINKAGLPASAFRAGEIPRTDCLPSIEEARGYTLVCDLDLAKLAAEPRYDVDLRATVSEPFDRIAYLLELGSTDGKPQYVWISMDAFTEAASHVGIPTASSGARFQQAVPGMTVVSNVKGLTTGVGLVGSIEFWPDNYDPQNAGQVPGASNTVYDFGDAPSGSDGYGSMQIHNPGAKETLFAINRWKGGGEGADLGIGNMTGSEKATDWTFAGNGGSYLQKRLRVFLRMK